MQNIVTLTHNLQLSLKQHFLLTSVTMTGIDYRMLVMKEPNVVLYPVRLAGGNRPQRTQLTKG